MPLEGFACFAEEERTVDDSGLVQIKGIYYAALPARLRSKVKVRIFENAIEIRDLDGLILRYHEKSQRKGEFRMLEEDRIFNPSLETNRLIERTEKIGPSAARLAREIFAKLGHPGQMAIYGLARTPALPARKAKLMQEPSDEIRSIEEYQLFWELSSQANEKENGDGNGYH